MVQITNALVAAAIIVPSLAAPVLESREPKGFGGALKLASKVASGASLGLTVGGLLQGREEEELEAREPITISATQVQSIAKGALAIGKTAKSAIEFGSAVAPIFPHKNKRSEYEEVEAREPRLTSAQAKAIFKGIGSVAKTAKSGIEFGAAVAPIFPHKQRRDIEELDERAFKLSPSVIKTAGHALAGAAGFAGTVALLNTQKHQQRDFEDNEVLDARFKISPSAIKTAGHALAGAAGFAGTVAILNTQKQQRDYDDIESLDARDEEFLDARDPKLSFGGVLKGVGKVASNFIREDEMDLTEREYDDAEFDAREYDYEIVDVAEREPGLFGGIIKIGAKVAKNFIRDEETGEIYAIREAVDIDELD